MTFAVASDFTAMPRWSMVNMRFVLLPRRDKLRHLRFVSCQLADNFLNQGVWVALVFGDLRRIAGHLAVAQMAASFVEHSIAQHFQQAFLPVLDGVLESQIFLF